MGSCFVSGDEAKSLSINDLFKKLESSEAGLSSTEAASRLKNCGSNVLKEKKRSPLLQFLLYFWGPIPWMIELAAILSALLHHWPNLIIILILLLVNGLVGFFEESQAGSAIAALKKGLALKCLVKRDGNWIETAAADLVPGDIVRLRLGNIIPADVKLFEGDYLSVDQAALTGESLPVSKQVGDIAFSGSVAKQGEMVAVVIATGEHTFFGKTAQLVQEAGASSHFQKAILTIGHYLIYISLGLALFMIIVQVIRGVNFLELLQFVLVLIIASIPVAMPAVLSVTMALGALKLSRMKAIVTKLESIEEMAGIDVLCSDKTGTLTQNTLTLGQPITFENQKVDDLLLTAALASKEENQDPIDLAVIQGAPSVAGYKQTKFIPFDPVAKRTVATVTTPDNQTLFVTKGAPQMILGLCHKDSQFEALVKEHIDAMAAKGYRTLGVARSIDQTNWEFLGLLPLFDPLRADSKETIHNAAQHGIQIKMLTGDNIAIAKEIAHQLEIGDRIYLAKDLEKTDINACDGFAEVFPEHKYQIIKTLQKAGHIVGMTGDGVNDSPALKQADVGIAVSGATDAARAAGSLVLTTPGLSVIINAIEEARRIFERMNSYAIYRIAETQRIMLFMVLCIIIYQFYPVSSLMIIMLALLNDIPIMTIVYDHTLLSEKPVRWQMKRVLTVSSTLGIVGVISTFLLIVILKTYFTFTLDQIQSIIFLKLSVAGHQTLFVARTRTAFYDKPYPSPILLGAILTTQLIAALIIGFGILFTAIPWIYILYIWIYTLIWMFIADIVKRGIYRFWKE